MKPSPSRAPVAHRTAVPLVLLFVACQTRPAAPDSSPAPDSSGADAATRLERDVRWLADDARAGRRAGTPGEREAAEWIAARLSSLGLEPAGEDGFLQPFGVSLPARDAGGSWIEHREGDARSRWSDAADLVPLSLSSGGDVGGPLAFRGYGIERDELDWHDYAAPLEPSSVVLLVRGSPERPEGGEGFGSTTSLFHKTMTAARMGAAAVLLAPHPDLLDEPLPAFAGVGGGGKAPIPALAISAELAEALYPGYADAARELATHDVATWTNPRRALGRVLLDADVERATATAYNVLGLLPGRAARGGKVVVVGAHFDHLGLGGTGSLDDSTIGQVHNGADDNASGTAVVLEVARELAGRAEPLAGDVLFALWSGEELGLLGSEHWVEHPTVALDRVVANVNLDMVGRVGDGSLQVLSHGSSSVFADWMGVLGPQTGLELQLGKPGSSVGGSDHQTFLKRKIPAVHLFSGLHPDYHKPSDDAERFEAAGAARVASLTDALVERMLAAPELPWVAQESTGAAPDRPRSFSVWFGTVPEYAYDGRGLLLAGTSAGSPAEKAGLQQGDVILQVGDIPVDDIHGFVYALQVYEPGDVVVTRYVRDGTEYRVPITLVPRNAE